MQIEKITIFGGCGKDGSKEAVERFDLKMGEILSIVGPTGCGKTTLINDIELYANENTPSRRKILINDAPIPEELSMDPSQHPIALISQHTNFLSDLPVGEFLETHAAIRGILNAERVIAETIEFANQLTGEPINKEIAMTELSGGQTRSLLIADAVIIGNAPIILLDEIENAGIHRTKALELLKNYRKIFIFVTHDPRIALMSDFRIVMKSGAMQKFIVTNGEEKKALEELQEIDNTLLEFRKLIRAGELVTDEVLQREIKKLAP
jgi:ABC-type lipoprotein export system ATPase subunit